MKKITVLIFVLFLLLFQISFSDVINTDSTEVNQEDVESKGIDLILIGGLGIADFSKNSGQDFNRVAAIDFGLEIPFTKSHFFSLELLTHSWIAKSTKHIEYDLDRYYIKVQNDIYTQIGLSAVIKSYFSSAKSKMRISIHFGWLILSPRKEYKAIDAGLDFNYKINEKFRLQLGGRFLFGLFGHITTPDLLMLNICYNFKW
ncbi:MAG: hypothetical protein RO257_04175 [Candidatus Kapabacteria bacterium]|nr:hypothetical protein [Candidatus Kapabacteria bacterium]